MTAIKSETIGGRYNASNLEWGSLRDQFNIRSWLFLTLLAIGLATRVWFVAAASSTSLTFHSGGSDAPVYNLLARNLLEHRGLAYAGEPTAFRPPGYPLLTAGFMDVFHRHYILAIRWVQFLIGLSTVGVCSAAAFQLFGTQGAVGAGIIGLFMPTLIYPTAQVLTECLAAFLTSLFLLYLIKQARVPALGSAAGLGITAGIESLIRFNAAALPLFAGWVVFRTRRKKRPLLRAAIVLLVPLVLVLPWLVRNEIMFHGRVLFSTQTGCNAVQGILSPEGRTQPGDTARLQHAIGWVSSQIETNNPSRRQFPPEPQLNADALRVVPHLWRSLGWGAIPLLARKLADFWLSADQIVDTTSLRWTDRAVRAAGVFYLWGVLVLSLIGWISLRGLQPALASLILLYALGYTVLHLPLVMNTRIRIPIMEPLLVILAGGGSAWLAHRNSGNASAMP